MMAAREMPRTEKARRYRKFLGILWIASISGITLALSDLANNLMDAGLYPSLLDWKPTVLNGLVLATWSVICWLSYRGSRRNVAPPEWGIGIAGVLGLAAMLLYRFG
jgi:hypothetical protein